MFCKKRGKKSSFINKKQIKRRWQISIDKFLLKKKLLAWRKEETEIENINFVYSFVFFVYFHYLLSHVSCFKLNCYIRSKGLFINYVAQIGEGGAWGELALPLGKVTSVNSRQIILEASRMLGMLRMLDQISLARLWAVWYGLPSVL